MYRIYSSSSINLKCVAQLQLSEFCHFDCQSYDQTSVNALIGSHSFTKRVQRFGNFKNATFVVIMNLCQKLKRKKRSLFSKNMLMVPIGTKKANLQLPYS